MRVESVTPALDWIIVGGESGQGARPMHVDWVRSLRDQCLGAGTRFLFKQWGDWLPAEIFETDGQGGLTRSQAPAGDPWSGAASHWWEGDTFGGFASLHVGKRNSGRLLDGREWNEMPRGLHRTAA